MFIDTSLASAPTPFGGAEFNESSTDSELFRSSERSRPRVLLPIYKHVTPSGVNPTINSEQLTTNH